MTWKPVPRVGADLLALPLDPRQGYLLSRLDGTLDVPALATLMNLGEDQVTAMLDALVALGAVASAKPMAAAMPTAAPTPAPAPEPESVPEGSDAEEDAPLAVARTATHRKLFEQQLHQRPVDERVALARAAGEPELSAFCFDPTTEVIRAVLENPRTGGVHARLIAALAGLHRVEITRQDTTSTQAGQQQKQREAQGHRDPLLIIVRSVLCDIVFGA